MLAPYRKPNGARGVFELAVTAVPFAVLWTLMWLSLGVGYWLTLLLAVPAAGLLVRLFMIQHDCGHGSFFRRRRTNDWVGRVDRCPDADALRLLAVLARAPPRGLGQSRPSGNRRHRHADGGRVSGAIPMAPAPLSPLPASDRDVRGRSGVSLHPAASAADRNAARWLAALAQHNGDERRHRGSCRGDDLAGWARAVPAGAPADHDSRSFDRRLAILRPAPVRGHLLGPRPALEFS